MPKEDVIIKSNIIPEPKEEVIEQLLQKGKPLNIIDDTQQKQLVTEIKDEWEEIKKERMDINGEDFDSFLDTMDRQRKGQMPKTAGRAYNLDTGLSQIKCSDIERTIIGALFGTDPIISVSPRPGFARGAGTEVCKQQQEFLDYAIDERIPIRPPMRLAATSAVYKKVGIIKWVHKVKKEKRIGHEKYIGNPQVVGQDPQTGQPITKNEGLEEFMLHHGETIEKDLKKNPKSKKYKWIVDRLQQGKKAEFDIEYDDVVFSDPFPRFIDNKDFYVRKNTEGYDGLCETLLIVERVSFSYYE